MGTHFRIGRVDGIVAPLNIASLIYSIRGAMVEWWRDEIHPEWVINFLRMRGLLDGLRLTIAGFGAILGIASFISLFAPGYPTYTTWALGFLAVGGFAWAVVWMLTPFPSVRSSLIRIICADAAMLVASLAHVNVPVGIASGGLFIITGSYLTLFHGPKAMAVHVGLATLVLIAICWRVALIDGVSSADSLITIAKALILGTAIVIILPLFNLMFWLVRKSSIESLTDPLTALANRRGLDERLRRQFPSRQAIWSLILIDLDNFKAINDQYGHSVGDQVLAAAARAIEGCTRTSDIVARMGGEEFVVVLNDDACMATTMAETMCRQLADRTEPSVTASFGIASTSSDPSQDCFIDALVSSADSAMYQAKSAGGNQVVIAGGTTG